MYGANQQIGPYRLIRKLGKGGFGEVWLAEKRTELVTKRVAVKLPLQQQVDLDAVKKEATLWERASGHPNVLPIIDADIYDGQVVIVSEYAEDGSLRDWLDRNNGKSPSLNVAVDMMVGILAGLAHLHSHRITHRDLKPSNILLNKDTPRIADFGISRVVEHTSSATMTMGTPSYMSPEAFRKGASLKTDIWSAGVVLHEMLAGDLPFYDEDMFVLMDAIRSNEPAPLPANIPPPLRGVVERALRKDPEERFESVVEMRRVLMNLSQDKLLEANRRFFESTTQPIESNLRLAYTDSRETFVRPQSRRMSRPRVLTAVILVSLVGASGIALWSVRNFPENLSPDATKRAADVSNTDANSPPLTTPSPVNTTANISKPESDVDRITTKPTVRSDSSSRLTARSQPTQAVNKAQTNKAQTKPTPKRKITLDDLLKDGKPP